MEAARSRFARESGGRALAGFALPVVVLTVALVPMLMLMHPEVALADPKPTNPQQAGEGIGDLIRGIAGPIVWSIAGLMGLSAFMRRDVGMAFTMLIITVLIGLFVVKSGQGALEGLSGVVAEALKEVKK